MSVCVSPSPSLCLTDWMCYRIQLQVYVEQNVVSHREELIGAAVVLHNSVACGVEAFSHLALDRLLKAPGSE